MKRGRDVKRQANVEQEYRSEVGRRGEKASPSMRLRYIRVVCEKKFKTAISIKFNLAQVSNQTQRRNETEGMGRLPSLPCKSPSLGSRGPQLRLPTIILKGRPFTEIYGFTWNFRLKFTASLLANVIPISVNRQRARPFHFRSRHPTFVGHCYN